MNPSSGSRSSSASHVFHTCQSFNGSLCPGNLATRSHLRSNQLGGKGYTAGNGRLAPLSFHTFHCEPHLSGTLCASWPQRRLGIRDATGPLSRREIIPVLSHRGCQIGRLVATEWPWEVSNTFINRYSNTIVRWYIYKAHDKGATLHEKISQNVIARCTVHTLYLECPVLHMPKT